VCTIHIICLFSINRLPFLHGWCTTIFDNLPLFLLKEDNTSNTTAITIVITATDENLVSHFYKIVQEQQKKYDVLILIDICISIEKFWYALYSSTFDFIDDT
jgi:hypothetical protein